MRKNILFKNWFCDYWIVTYRRVKLDIYITPHTIIYQNGSKSKHKRLNCNALREKNIRENIRDLELAVNS